MLTTLSAHAYITATGYTGTIYVDAVQLDEASAASTYNLVENGSFEDGADLRAGEDNTWYKQGTSEIVTDNTALFGTHSATLTGDANNRVMQRYLVDFPTESTFILSGWGKAMADPNGVYEKTETDDPFFGLILHFYYSDGNDDVFYYAFDQYAYDWQYAQGIAVPKSATDNARITKIYIAAAYDNNFGTAYMDNISLRMEPVQTYTYDEDGNPITTEQAGAGETNASYNGVDLMEYTAANGSKINYTYNDAHDILTATTDGVTSNYTYNSVGNVAYSTITGGDLRMQSSAAYSSDGDHTTRVRNANNQLVEYTYSDNDERLASSSVKVTDINGNEVAKSTTEYTYDNAGRTLTTTLKDPNTAVASIGYTYLGGRLSALTRTSYRNGTAQTQTYGFTYNNWGQSTAISVGNINLAAYEYEDNGGNLTKMTYGNNEDANNNKSVSYFYDNLDRLVKTVYNDTGRYVENAYTADGTLARLSYHDSTISENSAENQIAAYVFEYDSLGRLIRSVEYGADNTITQRTEHLYDEFSRLSSQSWVIQGEPFTESYIYNDPPADDESAASSDETVGADDSDRPQDGSLAQMTTASGATIDYTYDVLKRLQNTTVKSGETTLYTSAYAYRNLTTTQTTTQIEFHNVRDASGTLLTGAKYTYDEVGNIIAIYESVQVDENTPRRPLALYEYDVQNQLTSEIIYTYDSDNLTTTPDSTTTYAYTYDTAGNILTESKNGVVTKEYTYGDEGWNDLLTEFNDDELQYDAIGNPLLYINDKSEYHFTWVNGRRLS